MSLMTKQKIAQAGLTPALSAVSASDTFANDQNDGLSTFLVVHNGNAGACVVTIDDPVSQSPVGASSFNPDMVVSIPAGQDRWIGPLPASRFKDPTTGLTTVSYGVTSSVTSGAFYI